MAGPIIGLILLAVFLTLVILQSRVNYKNIKYDKKYAGHPHWKKVLYSIGWSFIQLNAFAYPERS